MRPESAGGWEEEAGGGCYWCGLSFWGDENVLELDSDDVFMTLTRPTEFVRFKWEDLMVHEQCLIKLSRKEGREGGRKEGNRFSKAKKPPLRPALGPRPSLWGAAVKCTLFPQVPWALGQPKPGPPLPAPTAPWEL